MSARKFFPSLNVGTGQTTWLNAGTDGLHGDVAEPISTYGILYVLFFIYLNFKRFQFTLYDPYTFRCSKALDFAVESSLGTNHRTSQPPLQSRRNGKILKLQEDFKSGEIELREFLEISRYLTEPDLQKVI